MDAQTTTQANTNVHFVNTMEEMRAYAKAGGRAPFPLKDSKHYRALLAAGKFAGYRASSAVPSILDGVASDAKSAQQASIDGQKTGADDATAALQSDKDPNSFKSKMDAQRDQAKKDSDAIIDKAYDQATALGEQYPDKQPEILDGMNTIMGVLRDVIGGIVDFLAQLISKAIDIIEGILKAPVQFIEDGFSEISGLLGSL